MESSRIGVERAMARQHGLITWEQALDAGMSTADIKGAVRHQIWASVRRGVYCRSEQWTGLDEYVGRPMLRARAVLLRSRREGILSHETAAHFLGLSVLKPPQELTHLTRPWFTGARTQHGVKVHLAPFSLDQVVEVGDLRVLDMARTACDVAREHGSRAGLVTCDAALRSGVPRSRLWLAAEQMSSWRGVTHVRHAIEAADGRAATAAESLARELVAGLGIGQPDLQFPVQVPQGVYWCDLRVGNHIFEVDGRIKYQAREHGGVADRAVEQVLWEEKKRQRLVAAEGLGVSRIVWADCWGRLREAARRRLAAEYDVTLQRFGPTLAPHLAEDAARIRAAQTAAARTA